MGCSLPAFQGNSSVSMMLEQGEGYRAASRADPQVSVAVSA